MFDCWFDGLFLDSLPLGELLFGLFVVVVGDVGVGLTADFLPIRGGVGVACGLSAKAPTTSPLLSLSRPRLLSEIITSFSF